MKRAESLRIVDVFSQDEDGEDTLNDWEQILQQINNLISKEK